MGIGSQSMPVTALNWQLDGYWGKSMESDPIDFEEFT